jgi:hypothetical protein
MNCKDLEGFGGAVIELLSQNLPGESTEKNVAGKNQREHLHCNVLEQGWFRGCNYFTRQHFRNNLLGENYAKPVNVY